MLGSIKGAKRANKTFLHCVGILAANGGRPGAKDEGGGIIKNNNSQLQ